MSFELILLVLIMTLIALAAVMHMAYLGRIFSRVKKTSEGEFKMAELLNHLELPQGSNFNTVMLASWSLFFVGVAYLFFQTPTIFKEWNYFQLDWIASSWYGLIVFGWGVMIVMGVIALTTPKIYEYYIIPRRIKRMMVFLVPLLLTISIIISIYLGTIYPRSDALSWLLGYVALFIPLVLLLSPVFISMREGVR